MGEAECRANITHRNFSCYNEVCPQCTAQCTYPSAKAVASVIKCTVARSHLGFVNCLQTTDAGQLARASHGAIRSDNYIAACTENSNTSKCTEIEPHCVCLVCRFPKSWLRTLTRFATGTHKATFNVTAFRAVESIATLQWVDSRLALARSRATRSRAPDTWSHASERLTATVAVPLTSLRVRDINVKNVTSFTTSLTQTTMET